MDRASDRCYFSWCFEHPITCSNPLSGFTEVVQPSIINANMHPNAFPHSHVPHSQWWDWRGVHAVSMLFMVQAAPVTLWIEEVVKSLL